MPTVNEEIQEMTIKSLESIFNKLSAAYQTMSKKGANTTLVKKRRDAVEIGLESLKENWCDGDFTYEEDSFAAAQSILQSLIPSIEAQLVKVKESNAQI